MTPANQCVHCGAPRRDGDRACSYCKTLYADAIGTPDHRAPARGGSGGWRPEIGGMPRDVIEALDRGNLIEAIKLYRGHTKAGLREAKDAVEAFAKTRPQRS